MPEHAPAAAMSELVTVGAGAGAESAAVAAEGAAGAQPSHGLVLDMGQAAEEIQREIQREEVRAAAAAGVSRR